MALLSKAAGLKGTSKNDYLVEVQIYIRLDVKCTVLQQYASNVQNVTDITITMTAPFTFTVILVDYL